MSDRAWGRWRVAAALTWTWLALGCGGAESFQRLGADAGTGGRVSVSGTGGQRQPLGSGGRGTGGAITAGTGGNPSTGGNPGTGGSPGSGGMTSSGGSNARTGGVTGSPGGASGIAGSMASGGRPGTGGTLSANGGATATGGVTGTAGTGAVTTVLSDDFQLGPGQWAGGGAADWSIVTDGTMRVYKEGTLSDDVRTVTAGNPTWADVTVEAKVKVLAFGGLSSSFQVLVCSRFQDAKNYYYVALDSGGKLAIKKDTTATGHTTLDSISAQIVVGVWYTIKLVSSGSTLRAFLDGKPMLTVVDRDLTTGSVALGTRNATAEFAAIRVTSP